VRPARGRGLALFQPLAVPAALGLLLAAHEARGAAGRARPAGGLKRPALHDYTGTHGVLPREWATAAPSAAAKLLPPPRGARCTRRPASRGRSMTRLTPRAYKAAARASLGPRGVLVLVRPGRSAADYLRWTPFRHRPAGRPGPRARAPPR
jgi:hypothetical protein